MSKLGDLLIKANLINREQLDKALKFQEDSGGRIGLALIKLGYVTDQEITDFLSQQFGVPAVNLSAFDIEDSIIKLIPADVAKKYQVLPINRSHATLTLAMTDPSNVFAMDDIKFMTGYNIEPVVTSELALREGIDKYYGSSSALALKNAMEEFDFEEDDQSELEVVDDEEEIDADALESSTDAAPVVKIVNSILTGAVRKGASDIHIEPYEKEFRVRYRIDGMLHVETKPPMKLRDAILSRVKIMAKLDISEKRLPQDGRIKMKMKIDGRRKELDFRVSSLPTLFGEKIVLRLLDSDNLMLDMTKLGFEQESLDKFERAINRPWGMALVTGPTGSGKTNTLYSAIQQLNKPTTNIMTAEDPVEFNMAGINQVQMKDQIGLNFAAALRSFLRQDPNIVLVGEIRDFETAEIAIKASLTGHLVLSTLHTNDAPSTINRLMNMGIEPFLVATSVHLIAAQRLIRRVCKECKHVVATPVRALMDIGLSKEEAETSEIYEGQGCPTCNQTGTKGRCGLFEVMEISDDLRELVLTGANSVELREQAIVEGMITLRRSGLVKIMEGIANIEEVLKETVL